VAAAVDGQRLSARVLWRCGEFSGGSGRVVGVAGVTHRRPLMQLRTTRDKRSGSGDAL